MPSLQSLLYGSVLVAAAALLIAACVRDLQTYRIPNPISLGLLLLFPLYVLSSPEDVAWKQHLLIFALVLGAGLLMLFLNVTGAGDVKLLAVTSLWAGPHLLALFLCITALAGGLLALIMAVISYRKQPVHGIKKLFALAKVPVPYGVAIAAGGLGILANLSPFFKFSFS